MKVLVHARTRIKIVGLIINRDITPRFHVVIATISSSLKATDLWFRHTSRFFELTVNIFLI